MSKFNTVMSSIGFMIAIVLTILLVYWVVKTVSYNIFYEGMVEQTIIENVKPQCLIIETEQAVKPVDPSNIFGRVE